MERLRTTLLVAAAAIACVPAMLAAQERPNDVDRIRAPRERRDSVDRGGGLQRPSEPARPDRAAPPPRFEGGAGQGRPDGAGAGDGRGPGGWRGSDGRGPGNGRDDRTGQAPGDRRGAGAYRGTDGYRGGPPPVRWGGNRPGEGARWNGGDPRRDPRWNGARPGDSRWNDGRRDDPRWNDGRGRWGEYRGRSDDGRRWNGQSGWRGDWRQDRRYDWRGWRNDHRDLFRHRYQPPRGWGYGYRPFAQGAFLQSFLYAPAYWLNDPWQYRLPPAYGPYRWVRYYDDVLLVDVVTGEVVDVIQGFFW